MIDIRSQSRSPDSCYSSNLASIKQPAIQHRVSSVQQQVSSIQQLK